MTEQTEQGRTWTLSREEDQGGVLFFWSENDTDGRKMLLAIAQEGEGADELVGHLNTLESRLASAEAALRELIHNAEVLKCPDCGHAGAESVEELACATCYGLRNRLAAARAHFAAYPEAGS